MEKKVNVVSNYHSLHSHQISLYTIKYYKNLFINFRDYLKIFSYKTLKKKNWKERLH